MNLYQNKNNVKEEEKGLMKMEEITHVPVVSHISAILHFTLMSKLNIMERLS